MRFASQERRAVSNAWKRITTACAMSHIEVLHVASDQTIFLSLSLELFSFGVFSFCLSVAGAVFLCLHIFFTGSFISLLFL